MKLFVWDFHGVLEYGNHIATIETVNKTLEISGYQERLVDGDYIHVAHFTLHGYFEFALRKGLFVPEDLTDELENLDHLATGLVETGAIDLRDYIRATEHSHEVLETIASKDHQSIVISNSPPPVFLKFLEVTDLTKYFTIGENAFPVSAFNGFPTIPKPVKLREYLQGKSFERIVYIGDSPSDLKLHEHFPGTRYLFTHPGFHRRDCEAEYKISDLKEILREV